jgi:hypothetical protein
MDFPTIEFQQIDGEENIVELIIRTGMLNQFSCPEVPDNYYRAYDIPTLMRPNTQEYFYNYNPSQIFKRKYYSNYRMTITNGAATAGGVFLEGDTADYNIFNLYVKTESGSIYLFQTCDWDNLNSSSSQAPILDTNNAIKLYPAYTVVIDDITVSPQMLLLT